MLYCAIEVDTSFTTNITTEPSRQYVHHTMRRLAASSPRPHRVPAAVSPGQALWEPKWFLNEWPVAGCGYQLTFYPLRAALECRFVPHCARTKHLSARCRPRASDCLVFSLSHHKAMFCEPLCEVSLIVFDVCLLNPPASPRLSSPLLASLLFHYGFFASLIYGTRPGFWLQQPKYAFSNSFLCYTSIMIVFKLLETLSL